MGVHLDVPYVSQLNIGGHVGHKHAWDDPTGCWYASACMVGYFFEQGPRRGVPELWTSSGHKAIAQDVHDRLLIKREGLEVVPGSDRAQTYTSQDIERLLAAKGPILFYWTKTASGRTYGHASVIVGTLPGNILYHDPQSRNNGGANRRMPLASLNRTRMYNPGVYGLLQRARIADPDLLKRKQKSATSVAALRQKFGG